MHALVTVGARRTVAAVATAVATRQLIGLALCGSQLRRTLIQHRSQRPAASLHTAAAPSSQADDDAGTVAPVSGYTGLFSYPFGLQSSEALTGEYRACTGGKPAAAALRQLQRHIETEAHALELDDHLQGKCASDARVNAPYVDLASRIDLLQAQLTQLEDTMLMERFTKTFVLYPPTTPLPATADASADSPSVPLVDGIRFDVLWTTHRHLLRQALAPCEHHARITVTPFRVVAREDGGVGSEDLAPIRLLETTGPQHTQFDRQALEQIHLAYGGPDVTRRQFIWLISFIASHPSDFAFDAISAQLLHP